MFLCSRCGQDFATCGCPSDIGGSSLGTPKPDTERPRECEYVFKDGLFGERVAMIEKSAFDALATDLRMSRDAYEMQKRVSERLEGELERLKTNHLLEAVILKDEALAAENAALWNVIEHQQQEPGLAQEFLNEANEIRQKRKD